MWAALNQLLKGRAPRLQRILKSAHRAVPVPLPQVVAGRWMLAHPTAPGGEAEQHVATWIEELLRPGDTFFDVGAYVGWMALVASKRVGRRGRVVAFEPSPPLAGLLRYHRRANLALNISIEELAVSDASGISELYLNNFGHSSVNSLIDAAVSYQVHRNGRPEAVSVHTCTLDDYCEKKRCVPRVVKIDVEGAEGMVLRGARQVLARYQPPLIVAVHPPLLPSGSGEEVFRLLERDGYKVSRSHTIAYDKSLWGDYLCVPM